MHMSKTNRTTLGIALFFIIALVVLRLLDNGRQTQTLFRSWVDHSEIEGRYKNHNEVDERRPLVNSDCSGQLQVDVDVSKPAPPDAPCYQTQTSGKVLILAYMRGGSSFTGRLFQLHPDVFYLFETLYMLKNREVSLAVRNNGTLLAHDPSASLLAKKVGVMDLTLNCEFDHLEMEHWRYTDQSESTRQFAACTRHILKLPKDDRTSSLKRCKAELKETCQKSPVKVIKEVAANMDQAKQLLALYPDLKVIHLIRDPRGILNSRRKWQLVWWNNLKGEDKMLCSQITKDVLVSKDISREFPNRILTVRYEDLAVSSVNVTKQMYAFLGLTFNSVIEQSIESVTNANKDAPCSLCTDRKNSTETSQDWRKQGNNFSFFSTIQKHCRELFKLMGYRPFQSPSQILNFNIPSTYLSYDEELLKVLV